MGGGEKENMEVKRGVGGEKKKRAKKSFFHKGGGLVGRGGE
jgi:hypothetical protein